MFRTPSIDRLDRDGSVGQKQLDSATQYGLAVGEIIRQRLQAQSHIGDRSDLGTRLCYVAPYQRKILRAILRALLNAGADPDAIDDNGDTPLVTAIQTTNETAVEVLIDRGASKPEWFDKDNALGAWRAEADVRRQAAPK